VGLHWTSLLPDRRRIDPSVADSGTVAVGELADSNLVRVVGYLVVASACCLAGARELRSGRRGTSLWPPFWFLTAAVFAVMAVGRATDLAEVVADVGRREAIAAGWYEGRRRYQVVVVGAFFAAWFVTVVAALWRVPERRRRYLPMALLTVTIGCFAAIRLVSLHQIDAVLYRRQIVGVNLGAVAELALLVLATALALWARALPGFQATRNEAAHWSG
jgi:hypothetical protein